MASFLDDRAEPEHTHPDFSDGSLGDDLRSFLEQPAGKSKRTGGPRIGRQLRTSFRAVPGARPLASHRPYGRKAGAALQSAAAGPERAPAPAAGADHPARRGAALSPASGSASTLQPAQPAAEGAAGGGIRRRRGRPAGRGKKKQVEAVKLPAAIKKLVPKSDEPKTVPKLIPTEAERSNATHLFREIGQRFNENRKKSKTAAYAGFRHDLMDNLDTLVMGGAIDLKEATTIITNLEQYTRETEAESTETLATILGRWLRMDAAEVAGLEVSEPSELVANEPDEDDEEEESIEAELDGESVFS